MRESEFRTYHVFRFLDGIRGSSIGTYDTLREAYLKALDLWRNDPRPTVDFRVRGPAPSPDVCSRLPYKWMIPLTGVWYVLESSPARPPAISATVVLKLQGESVLAPNSSSGSSGHSPKRSNNMSSPKRPGGELEAEAGDDNRSPQSVRSKRRRRIPAWLRDKEGLSGERRPDGRKRKKRKKTPRMPLSNDLLGIGIPAQWGKGRRSRKGDFFP